MRRLTVKWGRHKENMVMWAKSSRRRFIWRRSDALFVAIGYLRIRLMKPWRRCSLEPCASRGDKS